MTIRVAIRHRTAYHFAEPVKVYPHVVRLKPAPHSRTPIEAYSLTVEPAGHFVNWQQDPFGNYLARYVFPQPVSDLVFDVSLIADMTVINPFDFFVEDYAEHFGFAYPPELRDDLEPYLRPVDETPDAAGPGPLVTGWIDAHRLRADQQDAPVGIVDHLVRINSALQETVAYTVRMEPGVQTPDHTLRAALGSCRDSAWLLVSVLRELGLAARFVSGYLVQLVADEKPLEGPSGPAADFTDLHAWAEVFIPGAGWVGLDPTSGLFAGEGHIPLAATPHPTSAAPIEGATAPVHVEFEFENTVSRVFEDPRVTKPYTEQAWAEVDALGVRIDELLDAADVRLTMGGEPTFVSVDDATTPQWNGAADGPEKRLLAHDLAERLRGRWATGGVVHHGQGKWYPGEPLPRWQISMTWRVDGRPLWRDEALLAWPWDDATRLPAAAAQAAEPVARGIAAAFGVPDAHLRPAYDDPFERVWNAVRRPAGDPPTDDLAPEASAHPDAVAAELDASASQPRAWVVPLFEHQDGWGTAAWRLRRDRLFLTPGTSAAGYRLPLDSLAWTPSPEFEDRDPLEPRGDLADGGPLGTAQVLDIDDAPRMALVAEERDGHLFVFLPPLASLDRAAELLTAIEDAARAAGVPVVLEGYHLPGDPRVETLSVTPDPGVIEVNVQPTSSWPALRDLTTSLYDDARQSRLTTEKFDIDGTHTGTGGGNHFTLGSRRLQDSPLLRRPELLIGMLTYWQHHPSLSYAFSGRFIGPTSQAPRVDEGRPETLYELETAFAELRRLDADEQLDPEASFHERAWRVDGLLRHLLTDLTGNTHRAEFCIDKLYAPGSTRGHLGLLELRGFEMPPHAQMALVQALLVRTLVARLWDEPFVAPLIPWGTRLHDRHLLPAYAAADLLEVVADLNAWLDRAAPGGPRFDPAWLDPFLEFRFPRLGEDTVAGVHLELRQAVEPWHVLGEEATASGTTRYVDSSVERVQIAADDAFVPERHAIVCNGVPIAMQPLGRTGQWVAGVRFRAWDPPSSLHPTMGVHAPLTFELVDRASGQSRGGFTYHVVHPGGRAYDDPPVNAVAAESRRASRFHKLGLSSARVPVAGNLAQRLASGYATGTDFPVTTDLRRFTPGRPSPEASEEDGDDAS